MHIFASSHMFVHQADFSCYCFWNHCFLTELMGTPHFFIQGSFGPFDLDVQDIIMILTALVLFFFVLLLCRMSVQPNLIAPVWGCVQCTRLCDMHYFI